MDKGYELLSQDKVFDNNIILDYEQHSYEESLTDEHDNGVSKCARPNVTPDTIEFGKHSDVTNSAKINDKRDANTRKDVVLGSLNVEQYNAGYVTELKTKATEIKNFGAGESSSSGSKLDSAVQLCCDVRKAPDHQAETQAQLESERENSMQSCNNNMLSNVIDGGQLCDEDRKKCITVMRSETESQVETNERRNDLMKHQHIDCIETQHVNHETHKDEPFKVEYIEKDNEIDMSTDEQEEGSEIENKESQTILQPTDDAHVGSNLPFLNAGESIVVLTQDVNAIGIPNNLVSKPSKNDFPLTVNLAYRGHIVIKLLISKMVKKTAS